VMFMENVEEIQTWGPLIQRSDGWHPNPAHKGRTWKAFLDCLSTGIDPLHPDLPEILEVLGGTVTKAELVRGFGYHYEARELRACDYGTPTIRKRLFMVARRDGQPIVWPAPTHAPTTQAAALGLRPYRAIAECIDWAQPCHSIFLSTAEGKAVRVKRPLVPATLRRIATGMGRFVLHSANPFLVSLTHQGGERVESITDPINTITGAHRGEKALVGATIQRFNGDHVTEGREDGSRRHQDPQAPITGTGSQQQLVAATGVAFYGTEEDGEDITQPARTATTKARFGHVESTLANGLTPEQEAGARRVAAFLREYGIPFAGEFATITTAAGVFVIVDIGMRMLTPRELFRAQGFPESYVIDKAWHIDAHTGEINEVPLTKEQQIRMCGNSVCPPVAAAIVKANVPELGISRAERFSPRRHRAQTSRLIST
ncbi:MAG: DNA cytosine methyltransferase, partial [Roseimicrobium sp.]